MRITFPSLIRSHSTTVSLMAKCFSKMNSTFITALATVITLLTVGSGLICNHAYSYNYATDDLYQQHISNTAAKFESDLRLGRGGTPGHTAFCRVLYWNNLNMGFGHVAIEVFADKRSPTPTIYLSYAMGDNLRTDLAKHQKLPEVIELPTMPNQNLQNFRAWFDNCPYNHRNSGYGSHYNLTKNNCAHAVIYAMEQFGYKFKRSYTLCRPSKVKKIAYRIADSEEAFLEDEYEPEATHSY